ncbi:MAG: YwaF family protein [Myxococcota bacterium]
MSRFFDVSPGREVVNPMFGTPHLVAIAVLVAMVPAMWLSREWLRDLALEGPLVRGIAWFILADQLLLFGLYFVYDYEPFWERFPLHLCSLLCIVVPILILLGWTSALRMVAIWALGSSFMAIVNMSLPYNPPGSYIFLHYLWMHYFLFAFGIFLALRGDLQLSYVEFLQSMGALLALTLIVFLLNWALGSDYMFIGPSSTLDVAFIPASMRVWPYSYPTFMAVGIAFLHLVYFAVRGLR